MRILEVRRHTMRHKPGAHVSQDGIALARLVGESAGPYSLVVTSTVPRAIETAIAMGFEVNQTLEELGHLPQKVLKKVGWPSPFAHVAEVLALGGPSAKFAEAQAKLWLKIVEQIADGQQALVITHGMFVELGTLKCLPEIPSGTWGGAIGYCEGIRLTYNGNWQSGEILRVPEAYQLIEN